MDMSVLSWLADFFSPKEPSKESDSELERERARDSKVRYIADDPDPPENEAYKQ